MNTLKTTICIILIVAMLGVAFLVRPIASFQVGVASNNPKVLLSPGIHWQIPPIKVVDLRTQNIELRNFTVNTKDGSAVSLSLGLVWQVSDPSSYVSSGTTGANLKVVLAQKLEPAVQNLAASLSLSQLASNSFATLVPMANQITASMGVKILAIQVNAINLSQADINKLYDAMSANLSAQRNMLASQGQAAAASIQQNADQNAKLIVQQAELDAANIRAEGDSKAGAIYNAAYGANPKFYAFYRSLLAYQGAFNHPGTVLIVRPTGTFFQFFNSTNGLNQ